MPFAKAGEEFQLHRGGINDYITLYRNEEQIYQFKVGEDVSGMFDEWFEEVKATPSEYYYITDDGNVDFVVEEEPNLSRRRKAIGNIFETEEEAKKYLAYLKAKAIIKQDTKGFKPDWNNNKGKYFGYLYGEDNKLYYGTSYFNRSADIFFKSKDDIEKSFKKHPDEWKTYLTYEG